MQISKLEELWIIWERKVNGPWLMWTITANTPPWIMLTSKLDGLSIIWTRKVGRTWIM